jgi:hypothetical protein
MTSSSNSSKNVLDSGHVVVLSAGIFLVNFFVVCYPLLGPHDSGLIGQLIGKLWSLSKNLPFTGDEIMAKTCSLLLLLISYFIPAKGTPRKSTDWRWPVMGLSLGLLLYFGSSMLLPIGTDSDQVGSYIGVTSLGYLSVIYGLGGITTVIRYNSYIRQFARDRGFLQEERLIRTERSLNLPAKYQYNGRIRESWINIINPRRGVLILGSPGAGKSWFLIEPMIEQLIMKNRAVFVYDFKYPALTQFTYDRFVKYQRARGAIRFYSVNFSDLSRSHRCNLIDPTTLDHKSDAMAISQTILLGMKQAGASRQAEFFLQSSISYLAAIIWFLRNYNGGVFCTLPHVIEFSKASYAQVFTILNADPETRGLVVSFKDAYLNNTMEMLDGQIASARIPLTRLDSPDIYYVLSGNDVELDINNPAFPKILCLGGDPQRHEALAPVLSLFIERLNRRINKAGQYPCAVVFDEFATVRVPGALDIVATGRSNDIIPIIATQDLSQMTRQYSHDEANQVMNTCGNLICGQIAGETAKWVSQRFHENAYLKTTVSINSNDRSISQTENVEDAVTPATLAQLSSGEFIGVVADDPTNPLEIKGFHASITPNAVSKVEQTELPRVSKVNQEVLQGNFLRIVAEAEEIVQSEMKRILGDPALRNYIVKK